MYTRKRQVEVYPKCFTPISKLLPRPCVEVEERSCRVLGKAAEHKGRAHSSVCLSSNKE